MSKKRVTVSIDEELVVAANAAVEEGRARSMSGWVESALIYKSADDERLRALEEAIQAYETEHGVLTDEQIERRKRLDREAAEAVRTAARTGRGVA